MGGPRAWGQSLCRVGPFRGGTRHPWAVVPGGCPVFCCVVTLKRKMVSGVCVYMCVCPRVCIRISVYIHVPIYVHTHIFYERRVKLQLCFSA